MNSIEKAEEADLELQRGGGNLEIHRQVELTALANAFQNLGYTQDMAKGTANKFTDLHNIKYLNQNMIAVAYHIKVSDPFELNATDQCFQKLMSYIEQSYGGIKATETSKKYLAKLRSAREQTIAWYYSYMIYVADIS